MTDASALEKLFKDAVRAAAKSNDNSEKIDPDAEIMELRERARPYRDQLTAETFPFEVGDIVAVRKGSGTCGPGSLGVVVEIRPETEPFFQTDF